jgi:hypothetical protein
LDLEENRSSANERLLHRLKHSYRYLDLISSNLFKALPIFFSSRRKRGTALRFPAQLGHPFAISLSVQDLNSAKIQDVLAAAGIDLVRFSVSSDMISELRRFKERAACLQSRGVRSMASLAQRREDVKDPDLWEAFVAAVFSELGGSCAFFEIGQAWNLPGTGVFDYQEYLSLAHAAFSAAEDHSADLVGPAVAGFRFSLFPPLLKVLPFVGVSCQLFIPAETDSALPVGGKKFMNKLARLQAVIEVTSQQGKGIWLTDLGWPLPDEGKNCEALVRFLVPVLSTGLVERVFLPWHTVSPPSALKTLTAFLSDSIFQGKFVHPEAEIFTFCRAKEVFAVAWTAGESLDYEFPAGLKKIVSWDGEECSVTSPVVTLDGRPRFVVFENV